MRVLWVTHGYGFSGEFGDPAPWLDSRLASHRLRTGIPARFLARSGVELRLFALEHGPEHKTVDPQVDVAVFGKLLPGPDARTITRHYLEIADRLASRRVPIVADVCDNHFLDIEGEYLPEILRRCRLVTANCPAMADIVAEHSDREIRVIGDPVEGARRPPRSPLPGATFRRILRFFPRMRGSRIEGPLKLLWFGTPYRNYDYLKPYFAALARISGRLQVRIEIVTSPTPSIEDHVAEQNKAYAPQLSASITNWSRQALDDALRECDLVMLPSDPNDPRKVCASPNRVSESVWAGRFVVASGIPSYWQFKDCAWIGDDLIAGILWALKRPAEARERISRGQRLVESQYTPERIGRQWLDVLCGLAKS